MKSNLLLQKKVEVIIQDKIYSLLSVNVNTQGEIFIHFLSNRKEEVIFFDDKIDFEDMLYDHISYHKDGNIHIKHKGGRKTKIPFRLSMSPLDVSGHANFPLIAISYHVKEMKLLPELFLLKEKAVKGTNSVFTVTGNFTISVFIKDLGGMPKQERSVEIYLHNGALPINSKLKPPVNILKDGDKPIPIYSVCLNPSWDLLNNHLTSSSKYS